LLKLARRLGVKMLRIPQGWTLIETMISLVVGMLLLLLLVSGWQLSYQAFRQTTQFSELQYHAQFVHSFFQQELVNQNFWAGLRSQDIRAPGLITPQGDCFTAADSGSLPTAAQPFLPLFSATVGSTLTPSCLTHAKADSDFLQLKRLAGDPVTAEQLRSNRLYLQQSSRLGQLINPMQPGLDARAIYWPYIHQLFYVSLQSYDGGQIPVLMRKRLVRQASGQLAMDTAAVVDGIEMLVFEFGIDSNFDGQTDYFAPASQVEASVWQQRQGQVVQLRYFVLVRSLTPDPSYTNLQRYRLGHREFSAPADQFRRLLLSSAVTFHHP
jgi:type IV pilus assembly protein PilW